MKIAIQRKEERSRRQRSRSRSRRNRALSPWFTIRRIPDQQQQPNPQQLAIAKNKWRLRACVWIHIVLSILMIVKILPYIMKKYQFNISMIQQLEARFEIPEPDTWVWAWISSGLVSALALDACNRKKFWVLHIYLIGIVLLGCVPLLWGAAIWFPEVAMYMFNDDAPMFITYWKTYPAGIVWYSLMILFLAVNGSTIYFILKLSRAIRN